MLNALIHRAIPLMSFHRFSHDIVQYNVQLHSFFFEHCILQYRNIFIAGIFTFLYVIIECFGKRTIKDRQQEAERHSRHLTLLSSYVRQSIISYIPNDSLYLCPYYHINDIIIIIHYFPEIIDFKPIFPLLLFEHVYLAWYSIPRDETLHTWS